MKFINFDCTHCELKKMIEIVEENTFYYVGYCPRCNMKITINRKRWDYNNKLRKSKH